MPWAQLRDARAQDAPGPRPPQVRLAVPGELQATLYEQRLRQLDRRHGVCLREATGTGDFFPTLM